MNASDADVYGESADHDQVRGVPLSHLSIEVGHLYMEDIRNDDELIRTHFRRIAPWLVTATASVDTCGNKPRVSTCFLIDDYFRCETKPEEVIDNLLKAAAECGVSIDYIAREAGCCVADGVPLAELTAARLLPEPAPGTNGSRPPTSVSGWLCNGKGSPESDSDQAMRTPEEWRPPQEFSKRHHSIFVDIELWKEANDLVGGHTAGQRTWSCAFLASVWQLQRLGMLRYHGETIAQPRPWPSNDLPERWDDLPAVIKLNPHAAPFAAYRSISILPHWYLSIENAVRVILGHLSLDDTVTDQIVKRADAEGISISRSVVDRVSHIFIEGS